MGNGSLAAGLLGGVIGAVIGAGAMLALRPAPVPPPPTDADSLRSALETALEPLVAELRGSPRADAPPTSGRQRRTDEPVVAESRDASPAPLLGGQREMPVTTEPEPAEPLRPERSTWLPEPRIERLRELRGFEDDVRVRQRWLFLTEREALATFGTPGLVWDDGSSEKWEYEYEYVDEDGDTASRTYTLIFNRGRLVQFFD